MNNIENRNEFLEVKMPSEFEKISKLAEFAVKIKGRPTTPFRFYKRMISFLKYTYKGDLPKNIIELARRFKYADYWVALFELSEETYKQTYKKEYDNLYNNKSLFEKKKQFSCSDYGARSIFELYQDTVASNLFEDMLIYHGFGALIINSESTNRGTMDATTKCDLIYCIKSRNISIPLEVKTKWKRFLDDDEKVSMRGSAKTLIRDKGMVLTIYLGLDYKYGGVKGIVIDSVGNTTTQGEMSVTNKKSEDYPINTNNLMNFNFWVEQEMKNMLNNIYMIYMKREEQN